MFSNAWGERNKVGDGESVWRRDGHRANAATIRSGGLGRRRGIIGWAGRLALCPKPWSAGIVREGEDGVKVKRNMIGDPAVFHGLGTGCGNCHYNRRPIQLWMEDNEASMLSLV